MLAHPHYQASDRNMILEEKTYEKFGYYPRELSFKSGRKILVGCDDCSKIREIRKCDYRALCKSCAFKGKRNYNFGKHPSEETKTKMREHHADVRGKNNPNYGKHWSEAIKIKIGAGGKGKYVSEETKRKLRKAHKGEKNSFYGKQHSEETKQKIREARKHRKFPKHHTKPELIFENICKRNNLDFYYVGDGQLWVGRKHEKQLNPDFIEANGKKICVEIMGDYWHSPLLNNNLREEALLSFREKHFKRFGWKTVFIWEMDLKRKDAEQFVLLTLKKYL